jgi:cytidylate kinase
MRSLLITIDGPAGAGKTTVSRALAKRLGYRYIDTGALYRGVALEAARAGLADEDVSGLRQLCARLDLDFVVKDEGLRLISNGQDITDSIRTPEITMRASSISAQPVVRECLLDLQRSLGRRKCAVFEGRDMGTVVFPEADVKFFLDASVEARARRRYTENKSTGGQSLREVRQDIQKRDENDRTRSLAPLVPAEDAIRIDTTEFTVEEVVELMLHQVQAA